MKLLNEFLHKVWILGGLVTLLKKIDETAIIKRKAGSGSPKTTRSDNKIN